MPNNINALKVEVAEEIRRGHIRNKLILQERIMFFEAKLAPIAKKKNLTDEEKRLKEEIPANIAREQEEIADIEIRINNFTSLIKEFTEGSAVEK